MSARSPRRSAHATQNGRRAMRRRAHLAGHIAHVRQGLRIQARRRQADLPQALRSRGHRSVGRDEPGQGGIGLPRGIARLHGRGVQVLDERPEMAARFLEPRGNLRRVLQRRRQGLRILRR